MTADGGDGRVVTVVIGWGEVRTEGGSVEGADRVRILIDDSSQVVETGEAYSRAFVVRVQARMIPATLQQLEATANAGDLVTMPGAAAPLIERAKAVFGRLPADPPFAGEAGWARAVGAVVAQVTGVQPPPQVVSRARRAQVERIVGRYSGDRRLTPDTIASAIGVSRRTLYELAEPRFGGVSEYIRTARALRAASMLADPEQRSLSVAEIAHQAGFSSTKHLSRALLAVNGLSPASLRPDLPDGRADD